MPTHSIGMLFRFFNHFLLISLLFFMFFMHLDESRVQEGWPEIAVPLKKYFRCDKQEIPAHRIYFLFLAQ
jgi:hypothetical protein